MSARPLVPSAIVAALAVLIGCGGYQASQGSGARGQAVLRIAWPKSNARLIPASALSVKVDLIREGSTTSQTIQKPNASATFTQLEYGEYTVAVRAYPTANATGTPQALGMGTMTVARNKPGAANVALDSTVESLSVSPSPVTLVPGATASLVATAKDRDGSIVLLAVGADAEKLTWSISPPGVATIVGEGPAGRLTGNAAGNATVSATLKVKDNGATVAARDVPVDVLERLVAAGLAEAGYPVSGGDYGGSGQSRGPAAAGSVGATFAIGAGKCFAVVGPDGTLYAIAKNKLVAQGAANWEIESPSDAYGLTLTASGVLLVSTAAGIDARIASNGASAWGFRPAGNGRAAAVGRDGTVYVVADKLYALDGATGQVRWSNPNALKSRLAIGPDGTLYGQKSGAVVAIDPAGGATKWSVSAYGSDTGYNDPVVVGDTVYVKTGKNDSRNARSMDLPSWGGEAAPSGEGRSITGGATTGTTGGQRYPYYTFVNVSALRTSDGARLWTYGYPSRSLGSIYSSVPSLGRIDGGPVAVANGRVYSLTTDYVSAVDATRGTQIWRKRSTGTQTDGGVAVTGDGTVYFTGYYTTSLYFGTNPFTALDGVSGDVRWSKNLPTSAYGPPAIADDGTVYVASSDGKIVPIR